MATNQKNCWSCRWSRWERKAGSKMKKPSADLWRGVLVVCICAVVLAAILVPTIIVLRELDPLNIAPHIERTVTGRSTITTVEHDGHKWIEAAMGNAVDIEHHPDCQCHGSNTARSSRIE